MSQSIRISDEAYRVLRAAGYRRGLYGKRPFTTIGLVDEAVFLRWPKERNPKLYEWQLCATKVDGYKAEQ